MAQVRRHFRAIAAALLGLVALAFAPALAQDQGAKDATDLYDCPVLAIDPGKHTAKIWAQTADAEGRYAVTGGADRTVRVWSLAEGKLLRTIWIPVGPENVGAVYAVAISPDGSTIAAGGWTETRNGQNPIYLLDRESGKLIRRIGRDLLGATFFLTFSPDGRFLAATLGGGGDCGSSIGTRIGARPSAATNTEELATAQRSRATAASRRRPTTAGFAFTRTPPIPTGRTFAASASRSAHQAEIALAASLSVPTARGLRWAT